MSKSIKWNKVTDKISVCKISDNIKFTLSKQDIGVCGYGKALVLKGKLLGDKSEPICSFWIKDDGYERYREKSYKNRLWKEHEIEQQASIIINNLIENLY